MSRVVQMNNLGVIHFEAKNYQNAISLFHGALQGITAPSMAAGNECSGVCCNDMDTGSCVAGNTSCVPILKAKVPCDEDLTDSHLFLSFTQSMEIDSSPTAYSDNPLVSEVLMSAIIIWNMALVYHYTSRGNLSQLKKAYALYLKSWKLVEHIVCHGSRGNPMVDFFTEALLNNLGSCCQELDHESDARMWSDHLISYAQSIASSLQDVRTEISKRLEEQVNNFVLNAIIRLQCRPSFLAAAA
eukprot:CAMPEP_0176006388 /NCGR_PEP_ID=MMETSP0120_2-20121206/2694_1 /TAXON_ID=160619 /ORGANISM="Kryptoperidinium foliaceum, Strain CCMP 1326" /LENGTH=242 /DNA_ID=CAMNT_0017339121 /DNA_START=124 /DNA_END=852 /DNA_ORIENTATION=-